MNYAIVYSKDSGNTKLLSDAVKNCLNEEKRIYCGLPDDEALNADVLFIGFWTNQGTCDSVTREFLTKLKNKKIFLFGSAGFGKDPQYFNRIIERTKENINKTNEVIGSYMCQGRMPIKVREKYEKMKLENPNIPNIDMLIENFDEALPHPTHDDVMNLVSAIQKLPIK